MDKNDYPLIAGYLTDEKGNILCPYESNSILYTQLPTQEQVKTVSVSISGYITIFADGRKISEPIPFCMIQNIFLSAPKGTDLNFTVNKFHCRIAPVYINDRLSINQIKILIGIDTAVDSAAYVSLTIPQLASSLAVQDKTCIYANRIYDSIIFHSETCILHPIHLLKTDVYQYNAISDGTSKVYTNANELTEYGSKGILSPNSVSYYNVFVNGVLQPKANYVLSEGRLEFQTTNIPLKGQSILIVFITFQNNDTSSIYTTHYQYNAVANKLQSIFTNKDELKNSDGKGIPSPEDVSYFNLYVNGVLQPKANYRIEKGVLVLITVDIPLQEAKIILESVAIKDADNQLLTAVTYQYNTYSDRQKVYLSKDGLNMYGNKGILAPEQCSYHNLFVNGVTQPSVSYQIKKDCLILKTEDCPLSGAPITLQYVCIFLNDI